MKLYGIRNKITKVPLGVDSQGVSNDEFSVSVEFKFWEGSATIPVWFVKKESEAKRALEEDTPYYNAGYTTPQHGDLNMNDYEIFEQEIV